MGSGGYRKASPLDLFVTEEEAVDICSHIVFILRDHGLRELRTKARLAFLIDDWGAERFRRELERRADRPLRTAGKDARSDKHVDHVGVYRQKQPGLNYAGLAVPVGRITGEQIFAVAELAERYGTGLIRLTIQQNLIIPNVPDAQIGALTEEPLLQELRYDPSEIMRGLVSCTGMDYCHFALIETKHQAMKTARALEQKLGKTKPISICWSGCPAGCANQGAADIGLIGKNIKIDGQVEEAVDVYLGGSTGPDANPPIKILEDVPCRELLADVVHGLVQHGAFRAIRQQLRKIPQAVGANGAQILQSQSPPGPAMDAKDIADGAAKMYRVKGEEMAVFKNNGQLFGVQNVCPHEGGQLCNGWIDGGEVVCPLHGYKFDLKTGSCSTDPKLKVKVFKLVRQGDRFTVEG